MGSDGLILRREPLRRSGCPQRPSGQDQCRRSLGSIPQPPGAGLASAGRHAQVRCRRQAPPRSSRGQALGCHRHVQSHRFGRPLQSVRRPGRVPDTRPPSPSCAFWAWRSKTRCPTTKTVHGSTVKQLSKAGVIKTLFDDFGGYLKSTRLPWQWAVRSLMRTIVAVPIQRNSAVRKTSKSQRGETPERIVADKPGQTSQTGYRGALDEKAR